MGSELFFEGKKYISASRASKIIGYNSDYIGQLCRKNSLDCRMVGRTWFVSEESLKNHKVTASATPRGRIPIYKKLAEPGTGLDSTPSATGVTETNRDTTRPEHASRADNLNWSDWSSKRNDRIKARKFVQKIALGTVVVILLVVATADRLLPQSLLNHGAVISRGEEKRIISGIPIAEIETVKNEIASVLAAAGFSRHGVNDSFSYSANVLESLGVSIGQKASEAIHGISRGLALADSFLNNASNRIRLIVSNIGLPEGIFDKSSERTGVAVLPSADDKSANEQVKQYVIDSFSDETEIIPDESGNSGLIRPVFKERNDQEYLYVVVPVKEDGG